jgi:hypothetical protein
VWELNGSEEPEVKGTPYLNDDVNYYKLWINKYANTFVFQGFNQGQVTILTTEAGASIPKLHRIKSIYGIVFKKNSHLSEKPYVLYENDQNQQIICDLLNQKNYKNVSNYDLYGDESLSDVHIDENCLISIGKDHLNKF